MIARHEASSALAWLVDAGLDTLVEPLPRDWLAAPAAARMPSSAVVRPMAVARIEPTPAPVLEGIDSLESLEEAVRTFSHRLNPQDGMPPQLFRDATAARFLLISEMPLDPESEEALLESAMLSVIGTHRDGYARVNLLPWRTPGGRGAKSSDVEAFLPFAAKAIDLLKPRMILGLGQQSAQIADKTTKPAPSRGDWLTMKDASMMVTFLPATLLGQSALKANAWADLQRFASRLNA